MKKPELLCPIKNFASFEACKDYADAVYFGVGGLNMRSKANNITPAKLPKFVQKCHKNDIKAYMTVNSVIYNDDIAKCEKLIKLAKKSGVDAVIVWDPAAIEIAKKVGIEFHISTQANISNHKTAQFYKSLGAKRLVLAREMTLKQIKELNSKIKVDIETFIHGALCMAVSGRCILSAHLYGKSANCGTCAQPCREYWHIKSENGKELDTDGKYFYSSKDLCMIEHLPKLIDARVMSFKIEGRRRDPRYINTVARCYREAIDSVCDKSYTPSKIKKWKKDLSEVYNRGFTTGFYFGEPGKEGISLDKPDNLSNKKKQFVGNVHHYYGGLKVGLIKVLDHEVKVGDKILIEGMNTYLEQEVDSMQIDNKQVKAGKRKDDIAIKVDKRVRRNDKVYLIT